MMKMRSIGTRIAVTSLLTLSVFALVAYQAGAFATVKIAGYDIRDGIKATQDSTYGPYTGQIWANNFPSHSSGYQVLQADNYAIEWAYPEMLNLQVDRSAVAVTFHVFSGTSGECEAPFNFDGYTITDLTNAWVITDSADCDWDGDYANEVHIKAYTDDLSANQAYRGGAEFKHSGGGIYYGTGRVTNDLYIYYQAGYVTERDHVPTWCFNQSGGAYEC